MTSNKPIEVFPERSKGKRNAISPAKTKKKPMEPLSEEVVVAQIHETLKEDKGIVPSAVSSMHRHFFTSEISYASHNIPIYSIDVYR